MSKAIISSFLGLYQEAPTFVKMTTCAPFSVILALYQVRYQDSNEAGSFWPESR